MSKGELWNQFALENAKEFADYRGSCMCPQCDEYRYQFSLWADKVFEEHGTEVDRV